MPAIRTSQKMRVPGKQQKRLSVQRGEFPFFLVWASRYFRGWATSKGYCCGLVNQCQSTELQ